MIDYAETETQVTKRDMAMEIYDKIRCDDLGRKAAKEKYGMKSHEYLKIIFHSKSINSISGGRLFDICDKLGICNK